MTAPVYDFSPNVSHAQLTQSWAGVREVRVIGAPYVSARYRYWLSVHGWIQESDFAPS